MSKHKPSGPHTHKLMGGHHHHNEHSPEAILMRGHHFSGGATPMTGRYAGGATPSTGRLKKGGRSCHARGGRIHHMEGGPSDLQPTMAMQPQPQMQQPQALKRGGRSHGGREHHFWGALAGAAAPYIIPHIVDAAKWGYNKLTGKAEGGSMKPHYKEGGKAECHGGGLHRAMGGSGKVRKGIMTEKGDMR